MSKAKVLPIVVITEVEFKSAIAGIKSNGVSLKAQLVQGATYISQCTTKASQDSAKSTLAKAYQALQIAVSNPKYKLASAQSWVTREVKKYAPIGFKWAVSTTANAKALAKSKASKKAVAPVATKPKAKVEVKQTIVQLRDAWIAKEKSNLDTYRNLIPAGKIKDVEQATAAYIATLAIILN